MSVCCLLCGELKEDIIVLSRGTNGIGGWLLAPSLVHSRHTDFNWILDVELELSRLIPSKVVDTSFISACLETVNCLRLKLAYTMEATEDITVEYPTTSLFARQPNGDSTALAGDLVTA